MAEASRLHAAQLLDDLLLSLRSHRSRNPDRTLCGLHEVKLQKRMCLQVLPYEQLFVLFTGMLARVPHMRCRPNVSLQYSKLIYCQSFMRACRPTAQAARALYVLAARFDLLNG